MAPSYKLTYFNLTALGEPIRFLFHYGGIDFVDNRIEKADWPALKPKTPYGVLPLLEIDGKQVLHQSVAIARYVAKVVNLVGKNDLENWEIDAAVDTVNDVRAKLAAAAFETDETRKAALFETLKDDTLPFFLSRLDSQAKANKGYLAVGRLTWADLFFVGILDFLNILAQQDLVAAYPNLQAVRKNVLAINSIKAWVAKRPKDQL
ncbi:glutathione S-transferase-like [Cylas formicarius]|uniref:glutathione S-transferase-like n=1 Tax=Cylas formicarius TaxID=197179 RepID=UPI002958856F|nr:glutathione S-transferase-like [Cylas formicarius]